jgi:hypothetical protein
MREIKMRQRLNQTGLRAIIEALTARTAGEIDVEEGDDAPSREDYEAALDWALEEEQRRSDRAAARKARVID